jgi:hypothetical protein
MSNETAFLIALALSLLMSALVVWYTKQALHRVLVDLCGEDHRARYWSTFSNVMLLLVPVAALMIGHGNDRTVESSVFSIVDQLKWSMVGLILSFFAIAMGVAAFVWPSGIPLSIAPAQVNELHRLLAKVDEIRAREATK